MLRVEKVSKSYGDTRALREVSFEAKPGEVFAILGENGAGKSTLLRTLAGATRPDEGSLSLDGTALRLRSPREALKNGMVLIPQELAYVPELTVAENIMLGRPSRRPGIVTQAELRRSAEPYARRLGVEELLASRMSALSLADAQLVEIAKALARDARVLLLDEPTAALSQPETERLFATLDTLRERSIVLIYISHRLDEVMEHGDRVMVMRDGRVSLTHRVADVTKAQLIAGMLGRDRDDGGPARGGSSLPGPAEVKSFEAGPRIALEHLGHTDAFGAHDISFAVHAGEIVGVYGVRGGGQQEVLEALAGTRPHTRGTLRIDGAIVPPIKTVRQARRHGIAYIPPDRKKQGLVLGASIVANLSLPQLGFVSRAGIVSPRRERRLLDRVAAGMNLKFRGGGQSVRELSGGNQQKVLVGSRLATPPAILALQEPTRGVDVGARREIHELLARLADDGTAIVVATTDIEEAVELSDRLAVVRDGVVVAMLRGADKTQARALHEAVAGS